MRACVAGHVGENVLRQQSLVQIGFLEIVRVVQDAVCERFADTQIHRNVRGQSKMRTLRLNQRIGGMAEPP